MDKWLLRPLISIGNIRFGMKRSELRDICHGKYREFRKNRFSENTTDDFGGFHVYYSAGDLVEAVEIFDGIEVIFDGKTIFPGSIDELLKTSMDLSQDGDSYIEHKKSIGIYAPNGTLESFLAGSKGYYE